MDRLKKKELLVLNHILGGLGSSEIQKRLNMSKSAVNRARGKLLIKFNSKNTVGMIVEALKYGFLDDYLVLFEEKDETDCVGDELLSEEATILHNLLRGQTSNEIAKNLNCSTRSIDSRRASINKKWGVDSKVDLVLKSIRKGYIQVTAHRVILDPSDKESIWKSFQHDYLPRKSKTKYRKVHSIVFTTPPPKVMNLSPNHKMIIQLRLQGVKHKGIAEITGLQLRTVQKYYSDAKKKLRVQTINGLIKRSLKLGLTKSIEKGGYGLGQHSEQEILIIRLMGESKTYYEIASDLNISYHSVQETIRQLRFRFGVNTDEGVVYEGVSRGLIEL